MPRDRFLSPGEYVRLLSALPAERREYVLAFCALGVRDSELYRVTADDVDLEADVVHVRG